MIDKLHYISQETKDGGHLSAIKQTLEGGCKWIQLRVKNQPDAIILDYALKASELCKKFNAKLIVNDHPEVALKAGAYGLHLGLQDMPLALARKIVGKDMIIGGTANTFENIKQRVAEGADYIGLGPFRFTKTKQQLSPVLGIEGYYSIMRQVKFAGIQTPVIAVGGIKLSDICSILQTGIYGVALSAAITHASGPAEIIESIYQQLDVRILTK